MSRGDDVRGGEDELTPGWLADALDAEARQHVPDTRRIRAAMRKHTEAAPRKRPRLAPISRRLTGVPAGIAAGILCTALVFVVTTTDDSARPHLSAPSPSTARPLAGDGHIVTATGTVDAGSRAGWSQEDVAVTFTEPIAGFQLSVKVSLNSTGSSKGYSTTYDASLFTVTVDTEQAHALVYKFDLRPGKTLPAGSSRFAVQFDYAAPHNPAYDTYYVSVYTDKAHGRVADVAQGAF